MTKLKKIYCVLSFLFAATVLIAACTVFSGETRIYAAEADITDPADDADPDGITDSDEIADPDGITDPEDWNAGDVLTGPSDPETGLSITVNNETASLSTPVRALLILTILALAPSILIMMTSFTRVIIVLHFVRTAIGTQSTPPNQVMVGLALFLTFFIMAPTFREISENALKPLDAGEISVEEAFAAAELPIRNFMFEQTQEADLQMFMSIDGQEYPDVIELEDYYEVPFTTVVPAFIISELRQAFMMGFVIYIPFIVIDMVVASVLMSMGMMMLPPTTISLPFKILLFVMADGWNLIIMSMVKTFFKTG
ncbi:flagellar biosynthetic protein FliP [Clostridiales bacterium]|jgi:flagellar biosynthetic protein FliP|nr:flagellar type III secretion system pore protein FliP [Roseburia sp.]GFI61324.1 flagellar biosynthetic protein FliP [Clostridiales bacterium]